MRTTVTLDADVAQKLQDLAHRTRRSFKAVLNEAVRRGLGSQERADHEAVGFVVHPHASGLRPGLDPGKLNQINDQLETSDFFTEATRDT